MGHFAGRETIEVTTDASGDFTVNTEAMSGQLDSIIYTPDPTTPLATGADLVIASLETGQPILTLAAVGTTQASWRPRASTHNPANGVALVYAPAGSEVADRIHLIWERLSFTIANGGDTKSGTFHILTHPPS